MHFFFFPKDSTHSNFNIFWAHCFKLGGILSGFCLNPQFSALLQGSSSPPSSTVQVSIWR